MELIRQYSPYISRADVAEILGVNLRTIFRFQEDESFPKPIRITDRTILYRTQDLFDWVEAHAVGKKEVDL